MSASNQQIDEAQNDEAQSSSSVEEEKREEFTKQLFLYLQKSPSMASDEPIEKRGINKIQIDHVIDLLVNSKKKAKNYYKFK